MDLVRAILLAVEAKEGPEPVWMREFEMPNYPDNGPRRKHFISMAGAGFFDFEASRSSTNPDRIIDVLVFDLSWAGHEYLETIRDPKVWKAAKNGAAKAGNVSFEFVIEIAKAIGRSSLERLGLPGLT